MASDRSRAVPRCLIDSPYAEEEITLLEEAVLPKLQLVLEPAPALDTGLEAVQARCRAAGCCPPDRGGVVAGCSPRTETASPPPPDRLPQLG